MIDQLPQKFLTTPIPANETERLAALHRYKILDTPPEAAFDRITTLVARLFNMPIALISLVDESRAWFKSCIGFDAREVPRDATLCSFAVLTDQPLIIPDTRLDERFACNGFVQSEPGVRFYAGAPLLSRDGFNLGTLCLLDTQPRNGLTDEQQATLVDLAAMVVDELELRLAALKIAQVDAALLKVTQGVATVTGEAYFDALVQHFAKVLDADYVYIGMVEGDNSTKTLRTIATCAHGQSVDDLKYPLHETPCWEVIEQRKICCYPRNVQAQFPTAPLLKPLAVESYVAIPFFDSSGTLLGLLGVMDGKPLENVQLVESLLTIFALRIATELERQQTEAALRESEEKYRTLFNSMDEGFCMVEILFDAHNTPIDYCVLEVNPTFEQQTGLQQAIGKTARQLNLEDRWIEVYGQVALTGESVRFENGSEVLNRWFDVYACRTGDPQARKVAIVFKDISDRKQAEEVSRRTAEMDALCLSLTDALRPLADSVEIQATASRVLGKFLGANRVIYIEVFSDSEEVIVHENYTNGVAELSGYYRLEDYRRNLTADHQAGKTQIVTDIPGSSEYTDVEKARYGALDIAAHIDVPLIKNNQFVALLAVHQAIPRQWTAAEVKQVEETAERTWAAVERARAEEALRQSEQQFRLMADAVPQIVWITDAEGRTEFFNKQWSNYTGVPYEPTTAAEVAANFVHLEDVERTVEAFNEARRTGDIFSVEHRIRSAAGTYRWFLVRAEPYRNLQTGEILRWFGASVDIHDRKQAEAIIITDLENTRLLSELSARLIAEDNIQVLYDEIVSAAISLTWADAGSIQVLDESTQELVLIATQGIDRIVTDRFQRVTTSSITSCGRVLASGQRTFVDFDVPQSEDPDGSLRLHLNAGLISAQSTPLIGRSGRRIGMVSTHWRKHHRPSERELRFLDLLARQAADLIEQRQAAAEREQLLAREQANRAEADRLNQIKDEFLAVLSHELRSPLNPILGWTRLLQNGKLDAGRQTEALATIERNARLQTQLIEDLLDISRIMQGKMFLTVAPVSLPFVISAAIETVRLAAKAKQLQIRLDLDSSIAPVSGDSARLQQVMWNLLTNAVKFTPNGGQIIIELRQLDHLAQIRVIDTGKGINPQFLPHVFEYFRQEDGSTTRKFGGLGLGLAIVQQIVEMHGGTVKAESQGENQGATFIVQLPTALQVPPSVPEPTRIQTDLKAPLDNIQILLVDDEPDTREFQIFLLEQSGAKVTAVASGLEALQVLDKSVPNVLVSDLGMPNMDGYMLIEQIRSRSPSHGGAIVALALTAYAAEVDRLKAIEAGFQTFLTKPVEAETLVKTIVTLLDGKQPEVEKISLSLE